MISLTIQIETPNGYWSTTVDVPCMPNENSRLRFGEDGEDFILTEITIVVDDDETYLWARTKTDWPPGLLEGFGFERMEPEDVEPHPET